MLVPSQKIAQALLPQLLQLCQRPLPPSTITIQPNRLHSAVNDDKETFLRSRPCELQQLDRSEKEAAPLERDNSTSTCACQATSQINYTTPRPQRSAQRKDSRTVIDSHSFNSRRSHRIVCSGPSGTNERAFESFVLSRPKSTNEPNPNILLQPPSAGRDTLLTNLWPVHIASPDS